LNVDDGKNDGKCFLSFQMLLGGEGIQWMGSTPHWFRCFGVDEHKTDGKHSLSLKMLREMRREWMGSALNQYIWEVGRGCPLSEDWKHIQKFR
jgi:hypothetical protein